MTIISTAADEVQFHMDDTVRAFNIISDGGLVVVPTKVGYIIAGASGASLERKFELKERPLTKPAVVLTKSSRLDELAVVPAQHREFVEVIDKTSVLCGFILHRKSERFASLDKQAKVLSMLPDGSSCFVINHGAYTEALVDMTDSSEMFILASSANRSGTGNRGLYQRVGERILKGVDFSIEHDEYVAQRYKPESGEQGVMISLLEDVPVLIRKGLYDNEIMAVMNDVYGPEGKGWKYDHGSYA